MLAQCKHFSFIHSKMNPKEG